MGISYPLINGHRYDFSSIEMNAAGRIIGGFKEISYSDKLEPGKLRGNSAQIMGRTRGTYDTDASMTLYALEADELLNALGPGYMEQSFTITVMYASPGQPTQVDILNGVRIKGIEDSHSEGSEPIAKKFTLDPLNIIRNGKTPLVAFKR